MDSDSSVSSDEIDWLGVNCGVFEDEDDVVNVVNDGNSREFDNGVNDVKKIKNFSRENTAAAACSILQKNKRKREVGILNYFHIQNNPPKDTRFVKLEKSCAFLCSIKLRLQSCQNFICFQYTGKYVQNV